MPWLQIISQVNKQKKIAQKIARSWSCDRDRIAEAFSDWDRDRDRDTISHEDRDWDRDHDLNFGDRGHANMSLLFCLWANMSLADVFFGKTTKIVFL